MLLPLSHWLGAIWWWCHSLLIGTKCWSTGYGPWIVVNWILKCPAWVCVCACLWVPCFYLQHETEDLCPRKTFTYLRTKHETLSLQYLIRHRVWWTSCFAHYDTLQHRTAQLSLSPSLYLSLPGVPGYHGVGIQSVLILQTHEIAPYFYRGTSVCYWFNEGTSVPGTVQRYCAALRYKCLVSRSCSAR